MRDPLAGRNARAPAFGRSRQGDRVEGNVEPSSDVVAVSLARALRAASCAVLLLASACRGEPSTAAAASVAATDAAHPQRLTAEESHHRMLAALREVQQRTYQENLWQGDGAADVARKRLAALAADADPLERWQALLDVGLGARLGNEVESIAKLEEALAMLPGSPASPRRRGARGVFRSASPGCAAARARTARCATTPRAASCRSAAPASTSSRRARARRCATSSSCWRARRRLR